MGHIFLWPPLAWTVRVLLLVHAGGVLYVSTLYLARFLRPANARALVSGGLPVFTRVEGTAKVLGQELTLNADLDEEGGDQLSTLEERLRIVEEGLDALRTTIKQLLSETDEPQRDHG